MQELSPLHSLDPEQESLHPDDSLRMETNSNHDPDSLPEDAAREDDGQQEPGWGRQLLAAALQPPVVASIAGFVVALTSGTSVNLREILVDLHDRDNDAPLEWCGAVCSRL